MDIYPAESAAGDDTPKQPTREDIAAHLLATLSETTGLAPELFDGITSLEHDLDIDRGLQAQALKNLAEAFEIAHLRERLPVEQLGGSASLESLVDLAVNPGTTRISVNVQPTPEDDSGITAVFDGSDSPLPVVRGVGTPYEIGLQHGRNQSRQVKAIMQRMTEILGDRLRTMSELHEAIADPTMYFGEDDIEEIRGVAAGVGVPFEAALAHNLGLYPAYIPGCAQVAVTARRNGPHGLVHAVNEDSPISSLLGRTMSRIINVRHPNVGHKMVTSSISGQVGGLNGVNEAGLIVTTTILLDRPRRAETAFGKAHPALVKSILQHASDIDSAVEIVRSEKRMGGWSLCISHYPSDRLCYLEYDGIDDLQVQNNPETVLTTNHCLLFDPLVPVPVHSEIRMQRLRSLLPIDSGGYLVPAQARDVLRDRYDIQRNGVPRHPTKNTIRRVDNQASIVMRPERGELWITAGPMMPERENDYFRFDLNALFYDVGNLARADGADGQTELQQSHRRRVSPIVSVP